MITKSRIKWTPDLCKEILSIIENYPHNLTYGFKKSAEYISHKYCIDYNYQTVQQSWYQPYSRLYQYRIKHSTLKVSTSKVVLLHFKNTKVNSYGNIMNKFYQFIKKIKF